MLAMTAQLTGAFAAFGLEHQDLLVLALGCNLGSHHCAGHGRCPDCKLLATDHQYFCKFNLVADLTLEFFNLEKFAFSNLVLFSTACYYCVNLGPP